MNLGMIRGITRAFALICCFLVTTLHAQPPAPALAGTVRICAGGTTTLTAAGQNGAIIRWWDAATGGNLLSTSANYTIPVQNVAGVYRFYADQTVNSTSARAGITVTVDPLPTALIGGSSCSGNTITLATSSPAQVQWKLGSSVLRTDVATSWSASPATAAGGNGNGAGLDALDNPYRSFVDARGNVYVADRNNNRVVKWAPGATSGEVVAGGNGSGANANQLSAPSGVYVDASENVYVADFGNFRIQKWAKNALTGTRVAGTGSPGSGAAEFSNPLNVSMDVYGNLYVVDVYNNRIQKWAPGATSGTTVAGNGTAGAAYTNLNYPTAVKVDSAGNVYVVEFINSRVTMWAPGSSSGTLVAGIGIDGSSDNQLRGPQDLDIDKYGNLYIADRFNGRVQRWEAGATWGTTVISGGAPQGIALDANGNLYVTDVNSAIVKKYSLNSNLTVQPTVAGSYMATVTSYSGCVAASPAKTISQSARITAQPAGGTICTGMPLTLNVTATDPTGYQWQKNAVNMPGATAAAFGQAGAAFSDTGIYRVIVSGVNGCNDTSASAVIRVNPSPVASLSGPPCSNDTLKLAASSLLSQVQWKRNGTIVRTDAGWAANAVRAAGGTGGSGLAQLNSPRGIFVDSSGNVYVTDRNNHRVVKWAPGATQGVVVAGGNGAGAAMNQLNQPMGIYVDATQNVYVADQLNNRIQKWGKDSVTGSTVAGTGVYGAAPAQLSYPADVTMDDAGYLYIADYFNNRVQKWLPRAAQGGVTVAGNGNSGTTLDRLNKPSQVRVDNAGNIYVVEEYNHRVTRWAQGAASGVIVAGNGSLGSNASQLTGPTGIAVDKSGNVFVADQSNNRIQLWAPGATSGVTIAGTGSSGSAANQLYNPYAVALDGAGNLYVSDQFNSRVQRFTKNDYRLAPTAGGTYTATVTNMLGCTITTAVKTVTPLAVITAQPGQQAVCSGSPFTFSVTAGNATGYQWQQNGTNIAGATAAVWSKAGSTMADTGTYRVIAMADNGCNDTSDIAVLRVNAVPVISSLSGPACSGDTLTLTASPVPAQVQWQSGSTVQRTDGAAWNAGAATLTNGGSSSGPGQLYSPRSLFVDAAGNLYVADAGNDRVLRWSPGAAQGIVVAGGHGSGASANQFNWPSDVYVDAARNIYVADQFNQRIQKWAPGADSGITVAGITGSSGTGAKQLFNPASVTMDASGNLYVADMANHRIQKWAPGIDSGSTVAGRSNGTSGSGPDELGAPTVVRVDNAGSLYILESNNGRVTRWAPNATQGVTAVSGLSGAGGMAIDGAGNVYISYQLNHRIQRWLQSSGANTVIAGTGTAGSGPGQLYQPAGILLDAAGNLYVADQLNNRVQQFTPAAGILYSPPTVAGSYTASVTSFGGCTAVTPARTIGQQAKISAQPATTTTLCSGAPFTLTTAATGVSGYQWQKNGVNIPATAAAFSAGSSVVSDAGSYRVIAMGGSGCNDTSATALLYISPAPSAGLSGSACSGDTLNLLVSYLPVQVQWKSGGNVVRTDTATWSASAITATASGAGTGPGQLSGPRHAYADADGNLYVADAGNHRVVKWSPGAPSGVVVAGGNGAGPGARQLNVPYSVCVDVSKNIYIADFNNHRVMKWAPGADSGLIVAGTGIAGTAANQLNGPDHVTMDAAGNLYVTEYYNHRVQKWAPGAAQGVLVAGTGNGTGGSGAGALNAPNAARVDAAGNIYVADGGNNRVVRWTSGTGTPVVTGIAGWAADLEVDRLGNIYVADETNHLVRRWRPGAASGDVIAGTGVPGSGAGQLNAPCGIVFDPMGNLYVSDRVNGRVQRYPLSISQLSPPAPAGAYLATATGFNGCTSNTQTMIISQRAGISAQPEQGRTVCMPNPLVLTVGATNAIGYLWQKNGADVAYTATPFLNQPGVTAAAAGSYRVIAVGAGGCNAVSDSSTVAVSSVSAGLPAANVNASNVHIDGLEYIYTDTSCNPIASIKDAAGGNVLGSVTARLVLDGAVQTFNGQPYLQRHYDLQPASNGPATIKLYALQPEFDAFNHYIDSHSLNWPKLPAGPADATGIAGLSVTQYHGTPGSGNTGPGGQYNAGQRELIPNSAITTTWNGSYWTLSFAVSGFSGFFITSGSNSPLPVTLKEISARNLGARNEVEWQTATEGNGDYFEIERSADARQFTRVGTMPARWSGPGGSYTFIDDRPVPGINYYRLKMVDAGGATGYSRTVSALVQAGGLYLETYPNPVRDAVTVKVYGPVSGAAFIHILDLSGRVLRSAAVKDREAKILLSDLAAGVYLLRYRDEAQVQSTRIIRQ